MDAFWSCEGRQFGGGPPRSTLTEPGEWAHGWQFYASSPEAWEFVEDLGRARAREATLPGPVGLSGVEEEMVSDAVRLLDKGVRHCFAVWARNIARREWG